MSNNRKGIWTVVRELNILTKCPLSQERLESRFANAWDIHKDDLERPYAVFRSPNAIDRRFCQGVLLDLAYESVMASCYSLTLLAECSWITVLTAWFPSPELTEKSILSEENKELAAMIKSLMDSGEKLASEIEMLRQMLQSAMSERSVIEAKTETATHIISKLVNVCQSIHDTIEKVFKKGEVDQDLVNLAETCKTYRSIRTLFTEEGTDDSSAFCQLDQQLEEWCTAMVKVKDYRKSINIEPAAG
ncbi:MAG: hypothetical protein F6K11_19300 [Leptolyngbya sp. SIO3F4]|nr:hypothetical protein [Leptolyngbya sp. SIO3F4]